MLIRFFFFFIIVVTCQLSLAQQYATSPFTSKGIGETGHIQNPTYIGLGNAQSAMIDSTNLNYYNPSSYASLGEGQPIFSTGISINSSKYSQNNNTSQQSIVGINHFAFALSFASRLGIAFGIRPFASKGYDISSSTYDLGDTIVNNYQGSGNYSDLFSGLSIRIINMKKHKFSIGSNVSYIFGKSYNQQTTHLYSESIGGIQRESLKLRGYKMDFGANYQWIVNKSNVFTVTAIYNPSKSIGASYTKALIAAKDFTNETSFDTLNSQYNSANIKLPSTIQVGFKYDFINNCQNKIFSENIYHIMLTGEYFSSSWANYENSIGNNEGLMNTNGYALGLQITPHFDFFDRSKTISWFSKIRYRTGFQYATLPWVFENKQILNKSLSFGLGLPIVFQKSLSSFNVGCSFGERSNGNASTLTEKYFNVSFGFTIAPAIYDRWFRKSKID